MLMHRNIYDYSPAYGKLSQGSIINGCIAEEFPNQEVFGLVITPRCDLSHKGKVSTVHYLPVVPFDLWFDKIAKPIIKERWKKKLICQLNTNFCNAKIGVNVMDAEFTYEDLCRITEQRVSNTKIRIAIKESLDAYFEKDSKAFDNYLLKCDVAMNHGHEMLDLLRSLFNNSMHAFYLIEGWKDYGVDKHLVVMLRDVRHIEYNVAHKIGNGSEESMLGLRDNTHNDLFLTSKKDNFYYVQALIASPFIEHIMEFFVYNFNRIGVEDRSCNTLELLNESAKNTIK